MKSEKTSSPDSSCTCLSTSSTRDVLYRNVDICISRTVRFMGRPGDVSVFSTLSTITGTLPGSRGAAENMDKMPITRHYCLCYTSNIIICSFPRRPAQARRGSSYYKASARIPALFPGRPSIGLGEGLRSAGIRGRADCNGGFVKCSRFTTELTRVRPWSLTFS